MRGERDDERWVGAAGCKQAGYLGGRGAGGQIVMGALALPPGHCAIAVVVCD